MDMSNNPGLLLHKVGSMMERITDQVLFDQFGMGYSQFKVLYAIGFNDGLQQKDIASFLGQTEASISRQVKLLKQAGYVSVTVSDADRKKHHITPSIKGTKYLNEAMALLNSFYEPVLDSLSPHAQSELAKYLSTLHDKLSTTCQQLDK